MINAVRCGVLWNVIVNNSVQNTAMYATVFHVLFMFSLQCAECAPQVKSELTLDAEGLVLYQKYGALDDLDAVRCLGCCTGPAPSI